jgi:hypothetical protein
VSYLRTELRNSFGLPSKISGIAADWKILPEKDE